MRITLTCVYCGADATTKDHVVPRCFLEKPFPPNLLTVPSCRKCNLGYSKDEEYFLAVMAQTGSVPSLRKRVQKGGVVERMLERSHGLNKHFTDSTRIAERGNVLISPDLVRIANVTRKVAFGLYWHQYKPSKMPALNKFFPYEPFHNLDDGNPIVVLTHNDRFRPKRWKQIQTLKVAGLGKVQVLDYMFVRDWTDFERLFCVLRFHETVWAAVRCPHPPHRTNSRSVPRLTHAGQRELF
jgi:hypothetical protein